MKSVLAAALLALAPGLALAQAADGREALVRDIDDVRARWLPDGVAADPVARRYAPLLADIRARAEIAADAPAVGRGRREFHEWKESFFGRRYAQAKADGFTAQTFAQYLNEMARETAITGAIRQAIARQIAEKRVAETSRAWERGPGAAADGAATRPSASFVDADPTGMARYKKVRALLLSQGKPAAIVDAALAEALRQKADPLLVLAVIKSESDFDKNAVSYKRDRQGRKILGPDGKPIEIAHGLMQLTADKGRNLYDVRTNLRLGVAYLKYLWGEFVHADMSVLARLDPFASHRVKSAVAAYNAGDGAVQAYGGVPPYHETQGYVQKVLAYYESLKRRLLA